MNIEEHLLVVLSEECTEILTEIIENITSQYKTTENKINKANENQTIKYEMNDLFAVAELLQEYGTIQFCKKETKIVNLYDTQLLLLKLQYYISKSLRFGINEAYPDTNVSNKEEIENCLFYIFDTYSEIYEKDLIQAKKNKVRKFMDYAKDKKTLS